MALNADQQRLLDTPDGARSVIAGPGSGKSTMLVAFINSLIAKGVSPSDIRAITFSKEMSAILETKLKIKGIASTFHSLGYLICSETERKPVEPEVRYRLMCRLCKKWRLEYKELDQFIARMRRENTHPDAAVEEFGYGLATAYRDYEDERKRAGFMDFDSMLCDAVAVLEKPEARRRWSPRYVVVDESQDTDAVQFRLAQLMTEMHGNITFVGDKNQCIYGFRGAAPENIDVDFKKWFPKGRHHYLGINYRSTRRIVQFCKENAPEDTPQELLDRMVAARDVEGAPIGLKMYWSEDSEAESALALAGKDPLNSIILARTNRTVGLLERLCNRYNVRYHLMGKTGFWKQNEIRKAVEALKNFSTSTFEQACSLALPGIEAKYAVDDRTEKDNDALENLKVLRLIGKDFPMAKDFTTYANKMMHRRNDPRGVSISTVHQAKGLEFKNVFLIGVNAKSFPHPKGGLPSEERRIYFVAISRPIDNLRISFAGTPSPYLRKYLTDEILDKLREHAEEVDHLQAQHKLFV